MKKFDAALFDIDGTLLDTTEFVFQAFEHTLNMHKLTPRTRKEIGSHIGKHIKIIYENLAPGAEFEKLFETHVTFQMTNIHLAKTFPETLRTLETLKASGIKVAAITNRFRSSVQSLQSAGVHHLVDLVIAGDDVTHVKPHPEPILKALKHFNVGKKRAVMVGDTTSDMLAGKNAGVTTIGVTYGFHGKNLAKDSPDYLVDTIAGILPIILVKD